MSISMDNQDESNYDENNSDDDDSSDNNTVFEWEDIVLDQLLHYSDENLTFLGYSMIITTD